MHHGETAEAPRRSPGHLSRRSPGGLEPVATKIISVFATMQRMGLSADVASAIQIAVALAAAGRMVVA